MLGEVGSLFARGVIFHVWFRGHIGIISVLLFGKKGCERGWGRNGKNGCERGWERNAGKGLEGLVLCGLVGFWMVLSGFGAHAGPCWVRRVPCLQGG